jgi:putative ATP-dependent endonuclease of OLD family
MAGPRLERLTVKNLRSVGADPVSLDFPQAGPLVLLGENNAGKSNILRGVDMLFGERWPKSFRPEDHDFFGRDPDGIAISLITRVSGITCTYCGWGEVQAFNLTYDKSSQLAEPCSYTMSCTGCAKTWPSNEMRDKLFSMTIGADRRLDYQLSYRSQYTFLSRLMHRFHERLTDDPVRVATLKQIFEELKNEFGKLPEFAHFRNLLAEVAADFGQNLAYGLEVDFSAYDPSNFYRSLRVYPRSGDDIRAFDELGTGQEQVLALAFSFAYAQAFGDSDALVLVVEEPESHLHPIAQEWLASRLNELATGPLQVVLTTHSPAFVNLAQPENLVLVRKQDVDSPTYATQFTRASLVERLKQRGASPLTSEQTVGPFYAANATLEVAGGLFSRAAVLVEGPTEVQALPALLRLAGLDLTREGVSIIPVNGVSGIGKWHRFFSSYAVPVYAVFDSDSNRTGKDAVSLLRDRRDAMRALGRDESEAENPARGEPLYVDDDHACCNPTFETAAEALFGDRWGDLIKESAEHVGSSKALQARYAAIRITREELTQDGRLMLDAMAMAIRALLGPPGDPPSWEDTDPPPWDLDEPPF